MSDNQEKSISRADVKDATSRVYPLFGLFSALILFSSNTMKIATMEYPLIHFAASVALIAYIASTLRLVDRSNVIDSILDLLFFDFLFQVSAFTLYVVNRPAYQANIYSLWYAWEVFAMLCYIFRLWYAVRDKKSGKLVTWPITGPFTTHSLDQKTEILPHFKQSLTVYGVLVLFIVAAVYAPRVNIITSLFCYGVLGLFVFRKYLIQTARSLNNLALQRDELIDGIKEAQSEMTILKASLADIAKANHVFDKASALAVLYGAMTPSQKTAMEALSVIDKGIADAFVEILITASQEAAQVGQLEKQGN